MSKVRNQSDVVTMYNRLSIGLLICVAIVFALAAFFAYASQQALDERHELTMNAIRFVGGSTTLTAEVRAYAADGHEIHYQNYWKEIRQDKNRDIGLANMRAIGITDREESMISQMSSISNGLVPLEEEAMKAVRENGDHQTAINLVFGEDYAGKVAQIHKINGEFREMLDSRERAKVSLFVNLSRTMNAILGFLTIAIIVLQVKNMRYVRREVIQPIQQIQKEMIRISQGTLEMRLDMIPDSSEIGQLVNSVKVTKRELKKYIGDISTQLSRMASGKLDMDIDIDYIGDFKPIKKSMIEILDSLNNMISKMSSSVSDTAGAITERTERVSRGSDELARDASEQAKAIESLSGTVRSLSAEMVTIADNATRSHKSTASAAANLEESSKKMLDMQHAMEEINTASEGIKKITETIANIGSRTNIVAINAAIEAAKAGDVGRGFAVVADEVRNLAIMCGDASRETDKLLDSTVRSVERGFEITHDMTEAMRELIEVARQSANSVSDIAGKSSEQANALKEVAEGFENVTSVVHHNAATAQESAAAAEEMNEQAERLEGLRGLFDNFTLRRR